METQRSSPETTSGLDPFAKVIIMYDTRIGPGNTHYPTGNTYYYGNGTVEEWSYIRSLTEEAVQAATHATDVGGSSSWMVGHTGTTPYLNSTGIDAAMILFTYKGGQAPDN